MTKRRKLLQNFTEYAGVIDTPASFGTATAVTGSLPSTFTIIANIRWAVSYDQTIIANKLTIDVNGKKFNLPALSANEIFRGDYAEEAKVITVEMASDIPAGTVTFYVLDQWNRENAVATGTIT